MDKLRSITAAIIGAAVAGSAAIAVSPGKRTENILRFVIGLFIILSLSQPVLSLAGELELPQEKPSPEQTDDFDDGDAAARLYESEIERFIEEEAESENVKISSVSAQVQYDGERIIIQDICIKINEYYETDGEKFKVLLEEKIGVPVRMIYE